MYSKQRKTCWTERSTGLMTTSIETVQ